MFRPGISPRADEIGLLRARDMKNEFAKRSSDRCFDRLILPQLFPRFENFPFNKNHQNEQRKENNKLDRQRARDFRKSHLRGKLRQTEPAQAVALVGKREEKLEPAADLRRREIQNKMRCEGRAVGERFAPLLAAEPAEDDETDEGGKQDRMRKTAMPAVIAGRENENKIEIRQIGQHRADEKRHEAAKLERFFDNGGDRTRGEQTVCNW